MSLPDIREVKDLHGKKVLLRADLDVPIKNGNIINSFRLDNALLTIRLLSEAGARTIIIGHIGRASSNSLRQVYDYIQTHTPMTFVEKITGDEVSEAIEQMNDGDVVMLENLRSDAREVANDDVFAQTLATYADIFVNDAFSVAHREHASIVGIPVLLPSYVGIQFLREVKGLTPALSPKSPSLCVLGGAKFETKGPLIRKFVDIYDMVFVGGALSNDFFRARGYETGRSLVSKTPPDLDGLLNNEKIIVPIDVVVENGGTVSIKRPPDVVSGDYIYDAGPETGDRLAELVRKASFVLWNGPIGQYDDGYVEQTKALAQEIVRSSAHAVLGGGDTVASIADVRISRENLFLSAAGGAMLMFLLHGTLPGIEAIMHATINK